MPIDLPMGSLAAPLPESRPIDLPRLARVCDDAASAALQAATASDAIEAALAILHTELDGAGVSAFVLEHGFLWSAAVRGYAMIPDGLPLGHGVMGRVVRDRVPEIVVDVLADLDFVELLPGVVSELAIPLVSSGVVVGTINVETTSRLPVGGEAVVGSLASALVGPIEELREARTFDLSSLARLFVYMSSLREPSAIADVAARSLGRVISIETSQVLLLDESGALGESIDWRAAAGGPEPLSGRALEALRESIGPEAVFELLDTSVMSVPELVGTRARCVVLIPLRANGEEIGLLVGTTRFAKEFDRRQGEIASLLAAHAAASLDAALALVRERRSAHTDALTGLLNRRGLEEQLDRALDETRESRRPLSVIVLDCDDFKDVNDRAGHEFGDALLREIGLLLQQLCPDRGSAGRLGGDEFVVMLPDADADTAFEVAVELRRGLDGGLADAGYPLHLSVGLSTYPYDGAGASQLLRAADQALYRAKASGKNRIVGFRDLVRDAKSPAPVTEGLERGRSGGRADSTALADAMAASTAIWAEETVDGVLARLSKSATFVVGATGALISRVDGLKLTDAVRHSMRDVDLGVDSAFLISDFPVTVEVLESRVPRAISFLDDDLDRAEAFVLRELQMNCALMLPLVVHGRSWGLVEVYDMRLRRFSAEDAAVAWFLVCQAGRRIESLGTVGGSKRRLPLFRVPSS
jgi:diguanylate cyclase (GGDEF)-like protein